MNFDFTINAYRSLLQALKQGGATFLTFEDYCERRQEVHQDDNIVVLRHDVDLYAERSLATARVEAELGIRATYYFRIVPSSDKPDCIRAIAELGHEIGYHYEDMDTASGDVEAAWASFQRNLAHFRTFYPVRTVCMHGSPRSPYDNKDLWKRYDYHTLGLIGEPYYETDFAQLLYLTDTGRRWDGYRVSRRDKIPHHQDRWTAEGMVFRHTWHIIRAIEQNRLHRSIMFTTHPQRWVNDPLPWLKEFVLQNLKNIVKRILILRG